MHNYKSQVCKKNITCSTCSLTSSHINQTQLTNFHWCLVINLREKYIHFGSLIWNHFRQIVMCSYLSVTEGLRLDQTNVENWMASTWLSIQSSVCNASTFLPLVKNFHGFLGRSHLNLHTFIDKLPPWRRILSKVPERQKREPFWTCIINDAWWIMIVFSYFVFVSLSNKS